MTGWPTLLTGALLNFAFAFIIVRFVYYPARQDRDYVFVFLVSNLTVHFVMGLLTHLDIGVGVGFGLFALFSILRYRTDELPVREMTYLFVLMAMPVLNSVLLPQHDYSQIIVANGLVTAVMFLLEQTWGFRYETSKKILYDRIELVAPACRAELLADLRARTGLPVTRVELKNIDFIRDAARLEIYWPEQVSDRYQERKTR